MTAVLVLNHFLVTDIFQVSNVYKVQGLKIWAVSSGVIFEQSSQISVQMYQVAIMKKKVSLKSISSETFSIK